MKDILISLQGIQKKYDGRVILQEVNLEIAAGQAISFIGNNGTGKSTLLKIISGLVKESAGKLSYHKKLKISYVPEKFPALSLTTLEYLEHVGEVLRMPQEEFQKRCNYYFENFHMSEMINTQMKNLSKGTLQKVVAIQAFLQKPDVLLLDEPLSGQDIQSQQFFINEVLKLKEEGAVILMSCHESFLVRQMADVVYEIKDSVLTEIPITQIREEELAILAFSNLGREPSEYYGGIEK